MKNINRGMIGKVLALLTALVIMASPMAAFAEGELPAVDKTDRFSLIENESGYEAGFSMISSDGELVIHISDKTPVFFEDGDEARDRLVPEQTLWQLLDTRKLIVTYSITTKSLPPQTNPEKVVILYEEIVPLPIDVDQLVSELNGEIVVNGEIIKAPAPFISDGVVMVPVRAIAEALGFDVNWDAETKGVRLGVAINLQIGKDEYLVGRMAPLSLGTAPVLTDDRTYVPLSFFRDVISGYTVYVFEGQVVIESAESSDMN